MGPIDVGRHWWPRAAGLPIVLAAVLCLIHGDWHTAVIGLILGGLITAGLVIATIGSPRARHLDQVGQVWSPLVCGGLSQ